jgi:hypothetical protein
MWDWFIVTLPISGVAINALLLVLLGVAVGVLGGFFGMGGAWMVTPALNIFGFPMPFAVGTDLCHMAGKSIISTRRHAKFGNVDMKLGLTMLAFDVCGIESAQARPGAFGLAAIIGGSTSSCCSDRLARVLTTSRSRRSAAVRRAGSRRRPPPSSGTSRCTRSSFARSCGSTWRR